MISCQNPECSKRFEPTLNRNQCYCSARCRDRGKYLANQKYLTQERECIITGCNNRFVPKSVRQECCSTKCYQKAYSDKFRKFKYDREKRLTAELWVQFDAWNKVYSAATVGATRAFAKSMMDRIECVLKGG